jgi:hypothetical protein
LPSRITDETDVRTAMMSLIAVHAAARKPAAKSRRRRISTDLARLSLG